jgi:lipoic acid synthetase
LELGAGIAILRGAGLVTRPVSSLGWERPWKKSQRRCRILWRSPRRDILTLGQHLQPTKEHPPVVRFYHPDNRLKAEGEAMGIRHVESGPLVRSSYHAAEQVKESS